MNRQGNDVGTSYRSAIFYTSDEQKRVAEDTIADVDASGLWPGKVVTEVAPAGDFWEAEPEHQDYLERYPERLHLPLRPAGLEAAGAREGLRRAVQASSRLAVSPARGPSPRWRGAVGDAARGVGRQARPHPRLEQLDVAGRHRRERRRGCSVQHGWSSRSRRNRRRSAAP